MATTLQGISMGDKHIATSLKESIKNKVTSHSFYGSDAVEVELVSSGERDYKISMLLERCNFDDPESQHNIETLEEQIQGLVVRNAPVLLHSDEHILHGASRDVFLALENYSVDWQTSTEEDNMFAKINLDATFLGTPGNISGQYCPVVLHRGTDYEGVIASQSTIATPSSALAVEYSNIPLLQTRFDTRMRNLGHAVDGFANDTTSALIEDVEVGEVEFNVDTQNAKFLENAVKVYDEGYVPKLRITSKEHEYLGNATIETEMYRIEFEASTNMIHFYNAISPFVYVGTPFESVSVLYNKVVCVLNLDEFVRMRTDTGHYLEIERGKDPVLQVQGVENEFGLNVNSTPDATDASTNYINPGTNVYIASNYEFDFDGSAVTAIRGPVDNTARKDMVYAIAYYDPAEWSGTTYADSNRFAEVLVEIS